MMWDSLQCACEPHWFSPGAAPQECQFLPRYPATWSMLCWGGQQTPLRGLHWKKSINITEYIHLFFSLDLIYALLSPLWSYLRQISCSKRLFTEETTGPWTTCKVFHVWMGKKEIGNSSLKMQLSFPVVWLWARTDAESTPLLWLMLMS